MRESSPQREIVVPGDMRPSGRRAAGCKAAASRPPSDGALAEFVAGLRWFGGLCLRRPGEVAGATVAAGAALVIAVNALGYQSGRHPAPILPKPPPPAAATPAASANPAKPAAEQPAAHAAATARPDVQGATRDAIGVLIRSADDVTASVTPKSDKAVIQAQRALTRLGYGPLKDDGVMGPGTKAAIERFERERKLPVKGEASGRTLKELATRAALAKG